MSKASMIDRYMIADDEDGSDVCAENDTKNLTQVSSHCYLYSMSSKGGLVGAPLSILVASHQPMHTAAR